MSAASVRALDGGLVSIVGAGLPVNEPGATSFIVFDADDQLVEFGAGLRSYGEEEAGRLEVQLTEQLSLYRADRSWSQLDGADSGRLRLGSTVREVDDLSETVRLGVWEGKDFSLKTVGYGGSDFSEIVGLFRKLEISETAEGIAVSPRSGSGLTMVTDTAKAPNVVHYIQGLGLLDIFRLTSDLQAQLPRFRET